MAVKPSVVPRWAETGGGTPAAGITEPSSGQKDSGWLVGAKPPAQFFNWILWVIYQWIKYLNDGALTGNHTIAGTLGVTGNVDFDADLVVGDDLDVTGDAVVGGSVTATGDVESADVECHGTLWHDEIRRHHIGAEEFLYGFAGEWDFTGHTNSPPTPELTSDATANPTFAPVRLPSGTRIERIDFHWNPDGGSMSGRLVTFDFSDSSTSVISTTGSSSATRTTTPSATIDHRLSNNDNMYRVQVIPPASSTTAKLYGVTIFYNRPRP